MTISKMPEPPPTAFMDIMVHVYRHEKSGRGIIKVYTVQPDGMPVHAHVWFTEADREVCVHIKEHGDDFMVDVSEVEPEDGENQEALTFLAQDNFDGWVLAIVKSDFVEKAELRESADPTPPTSPPSGVTLH